MKKKTKLLIALLLVFVGVGLTYAVYTTSVGGNANVEAANWLIKVKTGSDFDNQVGIDVSNGATDINLGSCQKLAPGGSCTLPFRVDATGTEVDTILMVELGSNVTGATLVELETAGINLRISDGVNEDYAYLLNMGQYKDLNLVINWEAGDEDDDAKALADVNIANKLDEITIPVNMIVKQRLGGLRTVTFNTHDNNIQAPESIQVNDGETISNIPSLSKNGYIFVGWFTSENGGVQLTSSTIIVDNIEYHARFREPQNVEVSFNTHGGSNVNSVNVLEGGTLSELPSAPTKLGYTFAGWYTAETGGEAVTTSTVIDNTIEFHAQWTIKYVSVTFDSNGGSSVTSPVQVQEGGTINPLPVSTQTGLDLVGWFDSDEQKLTTTTQIMGDITYTASWKLPYAGTIVYYDPVDEDTPCNASTYDIDKIKNNTSTCYKWRIIDTDETKTNVNIQLDHNISNNKVWNGAGATAGPVTALTDLAGATSTWTRVSPLNYTYDTTEASVNYGVLSCVNGVCTISSTNATIGDDITLNPNGTPVRARLITAEEVNAIARTQSNGNTTIDNWTLASQTEYTLPATLAWLIENTTTSYSGGNAGATSNVYGTDNLGYWTLSPGKPSDRGSAIIRTRIYGQPYANGNAGVSLYYGTRPVITVPKTDLSFN